MFHKFLIYLLLLQTVYQLIVLHTLNGVFIPKLLWYKEDKRFLSYKEILNGGLENCYNISKLNSLGIEVIENDPDDIFLLTEDMFDLLNNKRLSKKDEGIRDTFMKNYFVESKFINKNISKEKFIHSGKISWSLSIVI